MVGAVRTKDFFLTPMTRPGFEPSSVELHRDLGPLKDPPELPRHGNILNIIIVVAPVLTVSTIT